MIDAFASPTEFAFLFASPLNHSIVRIMSKPNQSTRLNQNLVRLACVVGLVVALVLFFGKSAPQASSSQTSTSTTAEQLVSLTRVKPSSTLDPHVGTRPIEEIRVGDRVMAHNPEVSDQERESKKTGRS